MEQKHRSIRTVMDTNPVIWSEISYRLKDFHKYFELPQLVRVEDGYYDEKDETTLSRDDIMTLHVLQKSRFYKAVDKNGKEINIPVNLAATVETVSSEPIRTYHSIQELVDVAAKQVKSLHNHPWLLIRAGDVLQVQEVNNDGGVETLRLSFTCRAQDDVKIPLEYKANFLVLPDIRKLWLTEVENTFELPLRIKFTDETLKIKPDENGASCEDLSTIADLGDVTLQSIFQKDLFVASTRNENRTMVLKIPTDTDITVKAGVGVEEGDYTYVEVCQFYHERARLYQLDDFRDEECIRIGEKDAKVERIYEFVDEFSDEDDDGHDYEDMPPPVPCRDNRAPLHPEKERDSDDDDGDEDEDEDDDDYEIPEILPPVPTRVASLHQNSNTSTTNDRSLCARIIESLCGSRTPNENENTSAVKTTCTDLPEAHDNQFRYVEDSTIRSNTVNFNDREVVEEQPNNDTTMTGFPERLDSLNVEGVCKCLKGLNMECHVEQFRAGQIDGKLLVGLNDDLLSSLGVNNKFHRAKLLKFIGGWRPDLTASTQN